MEEEEEPLSPGLFPYTPGETVTGLTPLSAGLPVHRCPDGLETPSLRGRRRRVGPDVALAVGLPDGARLLGPEAPGDTPAPLGEPRPGAPGTPEVLGASTVHTKRVRGRVVPPPTPIPVSVPGRPAGAPPPRTDPPDPSDPPPLRVLPERPSTSRIKYTLVSSPDPVVCLGRVRRSGGGRTPSDKKNT